MDDRKQLRAFLSRKREGASPEDVQRRFCAVSRDDLSLILLREIRAGRVWIHGGRFYSKTQYQRAVMDNSATYQS